MSFDRGTFSSTHEFFRRLRSHSNLHGCHIMAYMNLMVPTAVRKLCSRQRRAVRHHQLVNMGVLSSFHFLVTVAFASVALCTTSPLKLRQIIETPRNWANLGRAPPFYIIPLRIGLPQLRFSELEQHLVETSDPFHPSYGKHLSKEDVEALVAPNANSVEAVHDWLESHGVQKEACHHSPAGDWVTVHLPVAQVEKMLGTVGHYASFLYSSTQRTF